MARRTNITARAAAHQRGYSLSDMPDGRVRAKVELPPAPDGSRRQTSRVLADTDEATAWAQETLVALRGGTYLEAKPDTFKVVSEEWIENRIAKGVRPVTIRSYRNSLRVALDAFGQRKVQSITTRDVRLLMESLGHRGKASNRLTMYTMRATFRLAAADGLIRDNPTAGVDVGGVAEKDRDELPDADADLIAAHIRGHRLEVCWLMTLNGLRRSEVLGLRWSDVSKTGIRVERGRVFPGEGTTPPKSKRGKRTIPMTPALEAAVNRTRTLRKAETLALGGRWSDDAFMAVDEGLTVLTPELYSDMWPMLMSAAGCTSTVTLHGARHGSITRMLNAGTPLHICAAFHGHDPAVMLRNYAKSNEEELLRAMLASGR